nr:hypothetical protein [Tanacetum cinerariifolium]
MRTRSSSNPPVVSPSNPSTSNPKRRNHRRSKQPFILEESPIDMMADQRTMAELLRAPTEGYAEAIVVPLILAEQFELKHAGGNLLERRTQDVLTIIENKSKCLAIGGNTFPELRDNIQGYVAAAAVNYNQGSGSLPSNTIANPKGELKAITTRSGIVLDGPSVPILPPFINPGEDERVEETLTNQDLAEYTIKVPHPLVQKSKPPSQRDFVVHQRDPLYPNIPYPSRMLKQKQQENDEKMLKALLSNKEKLQELANTPLNENCSAVILKKLPKKLRDPGKFLISCGFTELKCKTLSDLGASINFMPLSVWKKLGIPKLISTRMTLELANGAICTPTEIARDVFIPVGKFTFLANFVIVDYESDPIVLLILGRPFLRTARALIDVHGKEMILRDEGGNVLPEKFLDLDSTKDLHPPHHVNLLSGSTTSSSFSNQLFEEFADELALITFPPGNDDLQFDIESDLKEIEILLYHDPIKDMDSILKDSIDQIESDTENVYDDPFDSKGEKIKESKLLIDELDLPSDSLPYSEYDLILSEDFSEVDALPLTNNEDKVFNPEVSRPKMLLPFSSENEEKVFKPRIHTSGKVHSSLITELSHQDILGFRTLMLKDFVLQSSLPQLHLGIMYPNLIGLTFIFWHAL